MENHVSWWLSEAPFLGDCALYEAEHRWCNLTTLVQVLYLCMDSIMHVIIRYNGRWSHGGGVLNAVACFQSTWTPGSQTQYPGFYGDERITGRLRFFYTSCTCSVQCNQQLFPARLTSVSIGSLLCRYRQKDRKKIEQRDVPFYLVKWRTPLQSMGSCGRHVTPH